MDLSDHTSPIPRPEPPAVAKWVLDGCGSASYKRTMIPTPEQVIALFLPAITDIRGALRKGIAHADTLQPSREDRDRWYWSHSARWKACEILHGVEQREGWNIAPNVPNSGIHIRVQELHVARLLRSLGGTTPHPGRNLQRRRAWSNQGQLFLAEGVLPPLSPIIDWHEDDEGEPEIHLGLPIGAWKMGAATRLYWRVPIAEDIDLASLRFEGAEEIGEQLATLNIDPAEEGSG